MWMSRFGRCFHNTAFRRVGSLCSRQYETQLYTYLQILVGSMDCYMIFIWLDNWILKISSFINTNVSDNKMSDSELYNGQQFVKSCFFFQKRSVSCDPQVFARGHLFNNKFKCDVLSWNLLMLFRFYIKMLSINWLLLTHLFCYFFLFNQILSCIRVQFPYTRLYRDKFRYGTFC